MKFLIIALTISVLFNITYCQCLNVIGNFTCPSNCQCCSTSDTCSHCNYYYRITEFTIEVNITISLDNTTNSTNTTSMTQLVNQVISNCTHCASSFCQVCTANPAGTQNCDQCQAGYGIMVQDNSQCLFCSELNAQNCRSINKCDQGNNSLNCAYCKHFQIDFQNLCSVCSDIYRQCNHCNQNQCTKCLGGFYLNTTNKQQCLRCAIPYCQTCQSGPKCIECLSGFYLDGSNNCQICNYPCYTCDINGCLSCVSQGNKYLLLSNGTCMLCLDFPNTTNCISCIKNVHYQCLACSEQFYLDGILCSPCTSPCRTCNSSTQCQTCINSYYFNQSANTCHLCNISMTNCQACVDETVCTSCSYGFVVIILANQCTPCSEIYDNCGNCTIQDCQNCMLGFYMVNNSCLPNLQCSYNCLSCEILNESACFTCFNGYYLQSSNRTCMSCLNNCSQCTSDTLCLACNDGYFLSGSACLPCPNGTYYLNTIYNCLNCSSFCISCSVTACIVCESSFFSVSPLTGQCEEVCGDGYVLTLPCDGGIGIPNDGCSDSCQIEPGYNCTYSNTPNMSTPSNILITISQCSYTAQPDISLHKATQSIYSNNIQLVFQIKPYLLGMPTGDEGQAYLHDFFQLSPLDSFTDYMISVNPHDEMVSFDISYSSDISKSFLILTVNYTNISSNPIFQHLSYQQVSLEMNSIVTRGRLGQYYQQDEYTTNKLMFTAAAILTGLSYLMLFLGLFSRQLAGLEHMLLCQTIYLLVLFNDHSNFYLESLLGLKYSISIDIFNSQGGSISNSSGYLYNIDTQSFINNFNINFFFLLIPPLISALFMLYRIKNKHLPVKNDFGKSASELFIGEMLLYFVGFNYYGFVTYSYLYLRSMQKQQILNIILITATVMLTLFSWSSLFFRPEAVGLFRWAFSSYKTYYLEEPQKSNALKNIENCLSWRINGQNWKQFYRIFSINFYYLLLAYQIMASFSIIYSLHFSLFLLQAIVFILLFLVKPYLKPLQKLRSLFTFSILLSANFINYVSISSIMIPVMLICMLSLHLCLTAYIVIKSSYLQFARRCTERSKIVRKMFKQDPNLNRSQRVQEQREVINALIKKYHNLNFSEKFNSINNHQFPNEEPEEWKEVKQEISDNEYMLTEQRILEQENKHLRYIEGMGFIHKYGNTLNKDIVQKHYTDI